jgi:hypothetical protein
VRVEAGGEVILPPNPSIRKRTVIEGKISVSSTRSAQRKMRKNYVIQQESFQFLYSWPLYLSEVVRRSISCNTIYTSTVLYTYIHILTNVHGVLFCIFFRVTKNFSFSFPFLHFLSHFPLFTNLPFSCFSPKFFCSSNKPLILPFFSYRCHVPGQMNCT